MATGGFSEEVADVAECSVCTERFNDTDRIPKSLPCLHTFCIVCLDGYCKAKLENTISCPTCRNKCPVPREGVGKLPTNFMLLKLLPHIPDVQNVVLMKHWRVCRIQGDQSQIYSGIWIETVVVVLAKVSTQIFISKFLKGIHNFFYNNCFLQLFE